MNAKSEESRPAPDGALPLECAAVASQAFTLICWCRGDGAWKGSLALLFLGLAAAHGWRFAREGTFPRFLLALALAMAGAALLVGFALSG